MDSILPDGTFSSSVENQLLKKMIFCVFLVILDINVPLIEH